MVNNALHTICGEEGHSGRIFWKTLFYRQRFPAGICLIFSEAEGVLARIAKDGTIYSARLASTNITNHQLQGTADGGIRPISLAKNIAAGVHSYGSADGSIHQDHGSGKVGRRQETMHAEFVLQGGFNSRDQHRHILWFAASHDRIDGGFFDVAFSKVRRDHAYDFVW